MKGIAGVQVVLFKEPDPTLLIALLLMPLAVTRHGFRMLCTILLEVVGMSLWPLLLAVARHLLMLPIGLKFLPVIFSTAPTLAL